MVTSMTGFGRGKADDDTHEVTVELKTLNHRYLDVNLRLPRALSFLEDEIRKYVQQSIARGRVEAYIGYKYKGDDRLEVALNESVLEAYRCSFEIISERLGIENKPDLATIINIPDLFTVTEREEDEDLLRNLVFKALDEAMSSLKDMRLKEGIHLEADILKRAALIEGMVMSIEESAPLVVEEYRKKLQNRLKELLNSTELDENRFNTEVAYFADRSNITEELIRLKSHLSQLDQTLRGGGAVGRKLDFIVQEMNREANTIGSKSGHVTITGLVVEMKSEIEKIREQVQNLE